MGDGLLTIDGDFHRSSRQIMLPAFHREHLKASVGTVLEAERAVGELVPGTTVDLYTWTRRLAMRVAMRALFGVDPDGETARSIDAAGLFEEALAFYASEYMLRVRRDRRSPWARMQRAARRLDAMIYGEISSRRRDGRRGSDILSLLLDAHDEDGTTLSDLQIRDEVMTLLFAGPRHDHLDGRRSCSTSLHAIPRSSRACSPSLPLRRQFLGEQDLGILFRAVALSHRRVCFRDVGATIRVRTESPFDRFATPSQSLPTPTPRRPWQNSRVPSACWAQVWQIGVLGRAPACHPEQPSRACATSRVISSSSHSSSGRLLRMSVTPSQVSADRPEHTRRGSPARRSTLAIDWVLPVRPALAPLKAILTRGTGAGVSTTCADPTDVSGGGSMTGPGPRSGSGSGWTR